MKQSLPPLLALRTFEAAARHLSFKVAADELCVTPSSVSHQIKKLEDWLGAELFVRFNRQVALTQAGKDYVTVVSRAFADIAAATSAVEGHARSEEKRQRLVISANSGLIDCWLNNRMRDFYALMPNTDVEIAYGEDLNDYRHRDADIALHYGSSAPPAQDAARLRTCMEFVVCSPDLMIKDAPLQQLDDLEQVTLLHEQDRRSWSTWLRDAGTELPHADDGPVFQNTSSIFSRVAACEGVALGDDIVAADELFAGRLVKPLPFVRQSDWAVYLLPLRRDRAPESVEAFCAWFTETLLSHERETEALRQPATYPSDWLGR